MAVTSGLRKRRRQPVDDAREGKRVKSEIVSAVSLLDLPDELLLEIFALSANSALPECSQRLFEVCCAKTTDSGPPLWLQQRFIASVNPTLVYAVNKCLRRRFFGPKTLELYIGDLRETGEIVNLNVPLRLFKSNISTRGLMLLTELFLNNVTISPSSRDKGLVYLAAQPTVDPSALFWRWNSSTVPRFPQIPVANLAQRFAIVSEMNLSRFSSPAISKAQLIAAKRRYFGYQDATLTYLLEKLGCPDPGALYELAAARQDYQLITILQKHKISPAMNALRLMTM